MNHDFVKKVKESTGVRVSSYSYRELRQDKSSREELLSNVLYKIFKFGGVEALVSLRENYLKKTITSQDFYNFTDFFFSSCFSAFNKAGDNLGQEIQQDFVEFAKNQINQSRKKETVNLQKLLQEIRSNQITHKMLIDAQLLLVGVTDKTRGEVLSYKLKNLTQMLSFFYPSLYHLETSQENELQEFLRASIDYNFSSENILNRLKHLIVVNIAMHFLNPHLNPYKKPFDIVNSAMELQHMELKKIFPTGIPQEREIKKAWQETLTWGNHLDTRIRPSFPWKTLLLINLLILVTYKYNKISAETLLANFIALNLSLYLFYVSRPKGYQTFSNKDLQNAITVGNLRIKMQEITIENKEKGKKTIIISSFSNQKSFNNTNIPIFNWAEERPLTFFSYARTILGLTPKEAKALQNQAAAIEEDTEQEGKPSKKEKICIWEDGKISNNSFTIHNTNVPNFYSLLDENNIRAKALKLKIAEKDINSILNPFTNNNGKDSIPVVGGDDKRGIVKLTKNIPGTGVIDNQSKKVIFTHKYKDPDYGWRIYGYQIKNQFNETLLLLAVIDDFHEHEEKTKHLTAPNLVTHVAIGKTEEPNEMNTSPFEFN